MSQLCLTCPALLLKLFSATQGIFYFLSLICITESSNPFTKEFAGISMKYVKRPEG